MVSAPIPAKGPVDLQAYHREEGRKYACLFAIECAITIGTVFLYGSTSQNWLVSNWATAPTLVASLAAALTGNRWVQTAAIGLFVLLWVPYFVGLQGALS
jgi:hypothetical protein